MAYIPCTEFWGGYHDCFVAQYFVVFIVLWHEWADHQGRALSGVCCSVSTRGSLGYSIAIVLSSYQN